MQRRQLNINTIRTVSSTAKALQGWVTNWKYLESPARGDLTGRPVLQLPVVADIGGVDVPAPGYVCTYAGIFPFAPE